MTTTIILLLFSLLSNSLIFLIEKKMTKQKSKTTKEYAHNSNQLHKLYQENLLKSSHITNTNTNKTNNI